MGTSENSVVPQQNAGEMLARLDDLGFGKQEGRLGNTLLAMVLDAADEIERLRSSDLYRAGYEAAKEDAVKVIEQPFHGMAHSAVVNQLAREVRALQSSEE